MEKSTLFMGPQACGKTTKLKRIKDAYPEAPWFWGDLEQEDINQISSSKSEVIIVDDVTSEYTLMVIDMLTTAHRRFYAACQPFNFEASKYNYINIIRHADCQVKRV